MSVVHRLVGSAIIACLSIAFFANLLFAQRQASGNTQVYISTRNRLYHNRGCPLLGGNTIPIDIAVAVSRGYSPHSDCQAPSFTPLVGASERDTTSLPLIPIPAGEISEPVLAGSEARWLMRSRGSVTYAWQAEIENPNPVDIPAVVIMKFRDAADKVVHEAGHQVVVRAGEMQSFTQSGTVPEATASLTASWSFEVRLPSGVEDEEQTAKADVSGPEQPVASQDPRSSEAEPPPIASVPSSASGSGLSVVDPDTSQAAASTSQSGEAAFRARAGRPLGGIVEVVLRDGRSVRVTAYQIDGDRVTLTMFSGATMISSMSAIDFGSTVAAWEEDASGPDRQNAAAAGTQLEFATIDGNAQSPITATAPYLEWFRQQVDRTFQANFDPPNLLSDGVPSCEYVDANPTNIVGSDVCVARYGMSPARSEWPEVQIRIGADFEERFNAGRAEADRLLRELRAANLDVSELEAALGLRGAQLSLLSTLVRLTLSDARADGISVEFVRAAQPQFDDFGQPVPGNTEPYWSFEISRGIAARIGWDNFRSSAWPRIADNFVPGVFSAEATSDTTPTTAPQEPSGGALDIVDVSTRVTERNDVWWRFAWILVLRNNTAAALSAQATIEFVDADGFVIDDVNKYRLGIPANTEREFTGYALINLPGARNVTGVRAEAGARDAPRPAAAPSRDAPGPPGEASTPDDALRNALAADPRNAGIDVSVREPQSGVIDFSIQSIDSGKSMADVFRVFLQFAEQLQNSSASAVYLAFRGDRRFLVPGDYFRQLGREYGTQNPVYTSRTFPSQVRNLEGEAAYPTWTGGLIGVVGKQMEDLQDLHRKWYLDDLLALSK